MKFNLSKGTLHRYYLFIYWLVPDVLFRFKKSAIIILVTGFLGVAFQAQAFALVIYYANHFSSGESINIWGYVFDPRSSVELLVFGSAGILISVLLSAVMIYFSRTAILNLARTYYEFCSRRVLNYLSSSFKLGFDIENVSQNISYLFKLAVADSRMASRVLRIILNMLIPALTFIVAFSVLLYLEPVMTLIIGLFLPVALILQFQISRITAGHSINYEKLGPVAGREYRALIEDFRQREHYHNDDEPERVKALFLEKNPVKKQLDAYFGRLRTVETSNLISDGFKAVVLGVILLVMGSVIIQEGSGWGRLLIYLVALNYAMINMRSIFAAITAINRFYPQVRRYFLFVQSFDDRGDSVSDLQEQYQLLTDVDRISGSLDSLILQKGSLLGLVSPIELNRYTVSLITQTFLGDNEAGLHAVLASLRFATPRHIRPDMPLNEVLGLPLNSPRDSLAKWLPDEKFRNKAEKQLPAELNVKISLKQWERIDLDVKFVLSLISIVNSDCQFVFLDSRGLELLDENTWAFYRERLHDRITVIIYYESFDMTVANGEAYIAVANDDKLIGIGPLHWLKSIQPELNKLTIQGSTRNKKLIIEEDLDEEG